MRVLSAFQKCHSEIVMMQMRLMTLQFLGRYFIMELCLVPFPHPLGNLCTQEIIGEQHKRQRGFSDELVYFRSCDFSAHQIVQHIRNTARKNETRNSL